MVVNKPRIVWLILVYYVQNLDSEFPNANILMVTVIDEESRRIEQQPDSETLEEIMGVLKNMFGKDVPTAESIYVPRWVADPLFKGSYSNWPVGAEPIVFQQLQAPVQNIHFTGEHTSHLYSGYVHGAYLQGAELDHHHIAIPWKLNFFFLSLFRRDSN